MDVNVKRAGFTALLLAGLLLPLRTQSGNVVTESSDDRGVRLRELNRQLWRARMRWSALAERDSALALLGSLGTPTPGPTIRLHGFPPGIRSMSAETTLAKLWKQLGPVDSAVAVTLVVYNSANYAGETWWGGYSGDLITERNGFTWCIAIAPGTLKQDGRLQVGTETLDRVIAPCALLAAFGPPGSGVRAWLDATRYSAARSNGWLTRPGGFLEGQGAGPWEQLVDDRMEYYGGRYSGFSLARTLGWLQIPTLLSPPYFYGAPGVRCMNGEQRSCVEAVLHSALTTAEDPGVPRDLTVNSMLLRTSKVTLATPRPPAGFLLSDIIRAGGREKFRAFWKSQLPFEPAFQQAFGEPLGGWTARWARRQWLESWEAKYRTTTLILGADLSPSWPAVVLGWTALTLAAVAWAARRKQVT